MYPNIKSIENLFKIYPNLKSIENLLKIYPNLKFIENLLKIFQIHSNSMKKTHKEANK